MTQSLDMLSELVSALDRATAPVPLSAFRQYDTALLEGIQSLGILRQFGVAGTIACTTCTDDPHSCKVIHASNGTYRIRCVQNGWIDLSMADVTLVGLDRNALLSSLSRAAGTRRGKAGLRLYADGRLVRIGLVKRPVAADSWMLAYADGLENENVLSGIVDVLATQFPKGPGLVATPSKIPMSLPLPNGYRLIALHDLLGFDGELVIDQSAVAIRFGRRKKNPGRGGRPSDRETSRGIWAKQHKKSTWPDKRSDQAKTILRFWPDSVGQPSKGTIANHIRSFERECGVAPN